VADEYIGRVQLGTINNLSGANAGYGNFTALSTNLSAGSSYTVTITPTWTGSTYSEGYAVWIDYNRDGDFADAGERVWSRSATTTTPVSGTFTIPSTVTAGTTRIRVSMKYNAIPTYCETFAYGEVEDYTAVITTGGTLAKAEERGEGTIQDQESLVRIYPNPVKDQLVLTLEAGSAIRSLQISTLSGATMRFASREENTLNVSNLPAGMYILSVSTDKGFVREKFIKE
jgi:hypothetical protein